MKTKVKFVSYIFFVIAVVGIVVFFISRTQEEVLLPQTFAEMPEKPKLFAQFHNSSTINLDKNNPNVVSPLSAKHVCSVSFSPVDDSLIASVNVDGTIKLWNTGNMKKTIENSKTSWSISIYRILTHR